jgi:hypothetical protein
MKKLLLLSILLAGTLSLGAQTVITGWTFPVNTGTDSLNATVGLPGNLGYDIRFEGTDTAYEVIYFAEGATDFAAAATGWDNGADTKFWSVKFKAADYSDFKVSSKQFSNSANNGPRDFKLQWKISGGSYADVPSGAITLASDWTTGVVAALPVPVTGQGTSSVYIRWIMASNDGVNGTPVDAAGETRIDDILITGVSSLGTNDILYTNRITVGPNPSHGIFTVTSTVPMKEIRLLDLSGKVISTEIPSGNTQAFDLSGLNAGTYALSVKFNDSDSWYTRKIIVD